jgi:hypothetical protein
MLALAKIGRNPDTGLGAGDVACRLIHNDTFPSWRLTPSNTALRASGSVGTVGHPKPASAIPAHETGKQGQEDLRARTFQNLLALEFSCPSNSSSLLSSSAPLPASARLWAAAGGNWSFFAR